jgi:hypothetical protein
MLFQQLNISSASGVYIQKEDQTTASVYAQKPKVFLCQKWRSDFVYRKSSRYNSDDRPL